MTLNDVSMILLVDRITQILVFQVPALQLILGTTVKYMRPCRIWLDFRGLSELAKPLLMQIRRLTVVVAQPSQMMTTVEAQSLLPSVYGALLAHPRHMLMWWRSKDGAIEVLLLLVHELTLSIS